MLDYALPMRTPVSVRLVGRAPVDAWLKSLPIALVVPPLVLQTLMMMAGDFHSDWIAMVFLNVILIFSHLYAYAVLGLPLFLEFHRTPEALLWKPAFALVLGAALGCGCIFFYLAASGQAEGAVRELSVWGVGLTYGVVTAVAAWLQRPRRKLPPPFPFHRVAHAGRTPLS